MCVWSTTAAAAATAAYVGFLHRGSDGLDGTAEQDQEDHDDAAADDERRGKATRTYVRVCPAGRRGIPTRGEREKEKTLPARLLPSGLCFLLPSSRACAVRTFR